jgi:hypothetical protein
MDKAETVLTGESLIPVADKSDLGERVVHGL